MINLINQSCTLPNILRTMKKKILAPFNINCVSFDSWHSSLDDYVGFFFPLQKSWKKYILWHIFVTFAISLSVSVSVSFSVYIYTHRTHIFFFFAEQFISYKHEDTNPQNISACTSYWWGHFLHNHNTSIIPKKFNSIISKIQSIVKDTWSSLTYLFIVGMILVRVMHFIWFLWLSKDRERNGSRLTFVNWMSRET